MTARRFFTSDLHLGHEKVARLRGYPTAAEHDDDLGEEWRARVRPSDVVYVLGDVVGRNDAAPAALARLAALPGIKHLVAGNHDPVHPMHRRTFARELPAWLEVFASVSPFAVLKLEGREVLLQHFPYTSWGEGPERGGEEAARYAQYRLPDLGAPLLHGHTHGRERGHGHSLHVGIDAWGLAPVPEASVLAWLRSLPAPV